MSLIQWIAIAVLILVVAAVIFWRRKVAYDNKQAGGGNGSGQAISAGQPKAKIYSMGTTVVEGADLGRLKMEVFFKCSTPLNDAQQQKLSSSVQTRCKDLGEQILRAVFSGSEGKSGALTDLAVKELEPVVMRQLQELGVVGEDVSSVYLEVPIKCTMVEDWRPAEQESGLAPA